MTLSRTFVALGIILSLTLSVPASASVARSSDSFALSDGASLTTVEVGRDWCIGGWVGYGDFDGDGKTDLHCLTERGNLWRSHSMGASLLTTSNGREGWCRNGPP